MESFLLNKDNTTKNPPEQKTNFMFSVQLVTKMSVVLHKLLFVDFLSNPLKWSVDLFSILLQIDGAGDITVLICSSD